MLKKLQRKAAQCAALSKKLMAARKEQPIIEKMIATEMQRGLHKPEIFQQYEKEILARKQDCTAFY